MPIHKKYDKLDCANYRGISLLCHIAKAFSAILLQRVRQKTEDILAESQAGFRPGRSTIDQIFTLRQLAERYEEFGKELYVCYIDFRKAFDSVWRKGLWKVMRQYGYPEKVVKILENRYEETFSAVRVGGDLSDWFQTIVGVLQGDVLSPLLFILFLEIIIVISFEDIDIGVWINGKCITDLRFADDIAILADNTTVLQEVVSSLYQQEDGSQDQR